MVAVSPVPWVALVPLALGGAAAVVVESVLTGTLQEAVPDRYRAGALGLGDTVMVGACLVGSLVTPTAVAMVGARPTIATAAMLVVVPLLVGLQRGRDPETLDADQLLVLGHDRQLS